MSLRDDAGMRLIDTIRDHISLTRQAVSDVRYVAANLRSVGLDRAADELLEAVVGLNESAKDISDAHMLDVSGQIAHAEHIVGGMLKMALEGCIQPPRRSRAKAEEA